MGLISVLIGVLVIVVVGAICFWAIDKFATDRRLVQLLKLLVVLICLGAILQRILPLAGIYSEKPRGERTLLPGNRYEGEAKGPAMEPPTKEKKTAEELAVMIREDLGKMDGCPKRGVTVTVYRSQPMECDADVWRRCRPRPE